MEIWRNRARFTSTLVINSLRVLTMHSRGSPSRGTISAYYIITYFSCLSNVICSVICSWQTDVIRIHQRIFPQPFPLVPRVHSHSLSYDLKTIFSEEINSKVPIGCAITTLICGGDRRTLQELTSLTLLETAGWPPLVDPKTCKGTWRPRVIFFGRSHMRSVLCYGHKLFASSFHCCSATLRGEIGGAKIQL